MTRLMSFLLPSASVTVTQELWPESTALRSRIARFTTSVRSLSYDATAASSISSVPPGIRMDRDLVAFSPLVSLPALGFGSLLVGTGLVRFMTGLATGFATGLATGLAMGLVIGII